MHWEYKSVQCNLSPNQKGASGPSEAAQMAQLGEDGWELVSSVGFGLSYVRHYFKRRLG